MSKVLQDPLFNGTSDTHTYYYGWPSGCYFGFPVGTSRGQAYRLGVKLEIVNPATLGNDLDGSFYNGGTRCDDNDSVGYCIGVGTCSGW